MCGIFGYIGERDPRDVCLEGLKLLEYRGYDSSGLCGVAKEKLLVCKKQGKLANLESSLSFPQRLDVAIAHTRWATHGHVSDANAHPHLDATESIALIHNGIIENYKDLKKELLQEGISFQSETDSEVVVNLIAKYYEGDLVKALHKVLPRLKGIFSFLLLHKDHPHEMVAAARECPLSIALSEKKNEAIVSSDPNAFQGGVFDILFLRGDEIARIQKNKIDIFDPYLRSIIKKQERFESDAVAPSKGGFPHFMLKEIFEQPSTLQKAFLGRIEEEGRVFFEELKLDLRFVEKTLFLACGTSAHAAELGRLFLEEIAEVESSVEIASEARYKAHLPSAKTVAIALSQSGETADTLAAACDMKKRGYPLLAMCNVKNSTLVRESTSPIFLKAGPEISVCSTKAFTSQIASLLLLAIHLGQLKKTISLERSLLLLNELQTIPEKIASILQRKSEIEQLAKKYVAYNHFFFLGRRHMVPTAKEAALKLKEISYVNASAYPAGELKHGPIALLDENFPVIAFCSNEQTLEKMKSNLAEIKARRAPLLSIGFDSSLSDWSDDLFLIPKTKDLLAPFLSSVVGQLFAYEIAKARGCSIDQPRNLAKSVTVE